MMEYLIIPILIKFIYKKLLNNSYNLNKYFDLKHERQY